MNDEDRNNIIALESQLKSMEAFANVVIDQRNAAQNEAAQYKAQLLETLKGATS